MTIFDKIKNLFTKKLAGYAGTLAGYQPTYYQFGDDIYKSDTVQQAVSSIVSEISKLEPTHVRSSGRDIITPEKSDIQTLLDNPNSTMVTSEFLEKVAWNYFLNYNSFIIPIFDTWTVNGVEHRKYLSLNPVRPAFVTFYETPDRQYVVGMKFGGNPTEYKFNYKDIIHIKRNFSLSDFMGGDETGNPDNSSILKTLQLNGELLDNLAKSLKASTKINGVLKINSMLDTEAQKSERTKFEEQITNNDSGILTTDLKNEYQPIVRNTKIVDTSTLDFIDSKTLRSFGVPKAVLTGEETKDVYETFYQKTIEPLVIRFGQTFTKALFTQRERGFGNQIVFYPKALIFMSTAQKVEMVNLLGASGTLYENEKRTAFGLRPLKELEGVRMQSLNYVNTTHALEYQLKGSTKNDNSNSDSNSNDNSDDNGNNNSDDNVDDNAADEKESKMLKIKNELNARAKKVGDVTFENRSYEFDVRAKEDEDDKSTVRTIEGRPIVYDSKTDISGYFEEVIDKGALDGTDLKDVRFLVNHNTDELPLARSRNNNKNSTMQMTIDDKGMAISVKLDMNNPRAKELYSAVQRGDVSGMSFMFRVAEEDWDKEDTDYPTRHIVKIAQVLEVSAVTFPAYEDTELNARAKVLDNAKALLDSRKKSLDSEALELAKIKAKYGKGEN